MASLTFNGVVPEEIRYQLDDNAGFVVESDGDIRIYDGEGSTLICVDEMPGWLRLIRDPGFLKALEEALMERQADISIKEVEQMRYKIAELEAEVRSLKSGRPNKGG